MRLKNIFLACLFTLASALPAMAAANLTLGSASYTAGSTVTVPITLIKNGANISVVSMEINYDASKLSNPAAIVGPAATASNKTLYSNGTFNPPQPGKLRILIAGGLVIAGTVVDGNYVCNANDKMTDSPTKPGCDPTKPTGVASSVLNDGIVAYVTFTTLGAASGTITLGNIVDASDPSGNPFNTLAYPSNVINGVTSTLTPGTCNKASSSNLQKAINIVLNDTPVVPGMCEDFDNNGAVNSSDIQKIINAILAQ